MKMSVIFLFMYNLKLHFSKWVASLLPEKIVYRYLIWVSKIPSSKIFQEGFKLTNPSKTVVDIGANRGIVTYYMSQTFPKVHTFEPNTDLIPFLQKVLPKNCTFHPCGLSNIPGENILSVAMEEGIPINGRGKIFEQKDPNGKFQDLKIRLETLDEQNLENIGLIKIDVEGHEEKAIQGAEKTISKFHPILIVEIEKRHTKKPTSEIIHYIESLGYDGFFFEGELRRPVSEFKEHMQDPGYPYYINDFLFLPK